MAISGRFYNQQIAGARIIIESKGATRALVLAENFVGDRTIPNRQLSIQLYAWVQRNFETGGALQTPVWAPLKESTLKQKERLGYSSKPLVRTGHLRQSFAPFSSNDVAGVGARASSDVDYADVLQEGIPGRMEGRDMLPPAQYAWEVGTKIYDMHVKNSIKRAGL